jgi:diacylglycerol kinase (ATP)
MKHTAATREFKRFSGPVVVKVGLARTMGDTMSSQEVTTSGPLPLRKALVVVNPAAGRGRGAALARHALPAYFKEINRTAEIHLTAGPGDGAARIRRGGDFDHVVAVGGDGTLNEAAGAAEEMPIGLAPLGTSNSMARELGIPRGLAGALSVIRRGRIRVIDAGRVVRPGETAKEGRRFLLCASAGFDAAVVHNLDRFRQGSISYLNYMAAMLRCFRDYPFPRIRVTVDGKALPEGCADVIVTNTKMYGGPMRLAADARVDDGALDVVALYPPGRARVVRYLIEAAVRNGLAARGDVLIRRAHSAVIEADGEVPVQVDGEAHGFLPMAIQVEPGAVRMLA